MLNNLPSHKYLEMKDEQMLPSLGQQSVQRQALERLQAEMQAIEKERVTQHNQMIQNLIDMDTVKTSRIQVQRRSNLQN